MACEPSWYEGMWHVRVCESSWYEDIWYVSHLGMRIYGM